MFCYRVTDIFNKLKNKNKTQLLKHVHGVSEEKVARSPVAITAYPAFSVPPLLGHVKQTTTMRMLLEPACTGSAVPCHRVIQPVVCRHIIHVDIENDVHIYFL